MQSGCQAFFLFSFHKKIEPKNLFLLYLLICTQEKIEINNDLSYPEVRLVDSLMRQNGRWR